MRVRNRWTGIFLISISIVRASMGAYSALSGPTLLYLAQNVDAEVYKISTTFTGRSVGILAGSVAGGFMRRITGLFFRELLSLGFALSILAATELVIPWIGSFPLLIADVIVGGLVFGYLDVGIQAVILRLWGEKSSRSYIQLYHLSYSIGAFLCPFLANPFLARASHQNSTETECSSTGGPTEMPPNVSATTELMSTTSSAVTERFDPVGWAYIIVACVMLLASFLLQGLSFIKIEEKIAAKSDENGFVCENRTEEPIKSVWLLFVFVTGYYFCSTTTENVFYNYIYSIAICSDLNFTVLEASRLTSVFWLGFGLGRGIGVLASRKLQPRTIIAWSILGSIIDMTFMVVFGRHIYWMSWIVTASHGFTTSMLYPSGVSLVSQMTNISGIYMFVCNIGNACGSLSMLLLAGYLFDNVGPFSVMFLLLGLSVLNAFFFAAVLIAGNSRLRVFSYAILSNNSKRLNGDISSANAVSCPDPMSHT